ncbi:hypothetical protein BDP27DRAFT_1331274 [Rhodocollybia butyracea]|uniref:Uncharacterized protein n=1 Tax=Rhodocollybia butyracea TaxID=206335 RepID=A0A9P5PQA7_9AGAR|nr:hypothetical protein BDP27DRAFT_1331274 [Rhodocollybia butyracea]
MTPEEAAFLNQFATVVFYDIVYNIWLFVLYGARRISQTAMQKPQLILLCCTMVSACFWNIFVVCLVDDLLLTKYGFIQTSKAGLFVQGEIALTKAFVWQRLQLLSGPIMSRMSDAIVTWRAWVMWPTNKLVRLTLIFLMVSDTVVVFGDILFDELTFPNLSRSGDLAAAVVSVIVNIITTLLIAFKAWHYRQRTKQVNIGLTKSLRIMLLWIESGVIYTIFHVLFTIFVFLDAPVKGTFSGVDVTYRLLAQIVVAFGTIYPLAVFIIVDQKMSMVEETMSLVTLHATQPEESMPMGSGDSE